MCNKKYDDLCEICSVAENFAECRTDYDSITLDDATRKVVSCNNFVAKKKHKIKCTYECEGMVAVVEKEVYTIPDNLPWKYKRFKKPTVEEVEAYCREKGYSDVDAANFINYFDSVGWKVGKTLKPMTNWKMAVANWQKRQEGYAKEKMSKEQKNRMQRPPTYDLEDYKKWASNNTEI